MPLYEAHIHITVTKRHQIIELWIIGLCNNLAVTRCVSLSSKSGGSVFFHNWLGPKENSFFRARFHNGGMIMQLHFSVKNYYHQPPVKNNLATVHKCFFEGFHHFGLYMVMYYSSVTCDRLFLEKKKRGVAIILASKHTEEYYHQMYFYS